MDLCNSCLDDLIEKVYAREIYKRDRLRKFERKEMSLKLMYITNDPNVALIAEKYGVERIWIDLETMGKEERQRNMNTVKSQHTVEDIKKIKPLLTKSEMLVRINPWNGNSVQEINAVIEAGADVLMLPMWKSAAEVGKFLSVVAGRCKTMLLLETKEAVACIDEVLVHGGFDEIHIGLNDLYLSYRLTFMFELLINGTVEMLCRKFRSAGFPYGFGGIARLGFGDLLAERIIMEHYRLGSTKAILSRSFCDTDLVKDLDQIEEIFKINLKKLRDFEEMLDVGEFEVNRRIVEETVERIVAGKKAVTVINKETINALREEYGEAFYLLDSEQFRKNCLELKSIFSAVYPNFNIAYSYKTNYIPKLCKIVNELGCYAEVVSEMEMELALKCGVRPGKIIWNGPVKKAKEMARFLFNGGTVNIDSIDEAEFIRELAETTEKTLYVGLRCNFDVSDGVVSRFGFDIDGEDFRKALRIIQSTGNIHLINFQCHFAKRQVEYWPARAEGMVGLVDRLGIIPERIDIGGGIYGKMPSSLKAQFPFGISSYREYAQAAATVFANYFKDKDFKPELLIEPGSAVVGDCMKFVGTVKTIKNIRGKYIASVLGSQGNINMAGVNPPVEIVHMGEETIEYEELDMVGFTCIEGDVLYRNYSGPLAKGDAVLISNCGSYSIVMKPPFILPNFPVLDLGGGQVEMIKRGEGFDDIFHTFHF